MSIKRYISAPLMFVALTANASIPHIKSGTITVLTSQPSFAIANVIDNSQNITSLATTRFLQDANKYEARHLGGALLSQTVVCSYCAFGFCLKCVFSD